MSKDTLTVSFKQSTVTIPDKFITLFKKYSKEDLLPSKPGMVLTIDMKGNILYFNAIRRVIKEEIPYKYMTFSPDALETTDDKIRYLKHELLKTIQSIEIKQDIKMDKEFKLNFENKSETSVMITSRDIDAKGEYFTETFPIAMIDPGKKLKISKIVIKESTGLINAVHSFPLVIEWKVMELDKVGSYDKEEIPDELKPQHTDYFHTIMTLRQLRYTDPIDVFKLSIQCIIQRLMKISDLISQYKPKSLSDNIIIVEKEGMYGRSKSENKKINIISYIIKDETKTLGDIIVFKTQSLDKSIEYAKCEMTDYSESKGIKIELATGTNELILLAIKELIKTYQSIKIL